MTHIRVPLRRLRLRTPRLELRLGSLAELRALAELFREGTYPEEMGPVTSGRFFEGVQQPDRPDNFVNHHQSWLDESTPREWFFTFLVFGDPA